MDLTFNGLDLIFYLAGLFVAYVVIPDEFKEEIGAILGWIILVFYTITYFILFFFHYDIQFNIVAQ